MTTKAQPTTKTLLAAAAGLALALTGAACSGDGGENEAAPEARAAQTTVRTGETGEADASSTRVATARFDVDGMTCGGCALATEMSVKKLEGVKSVDAEYHEEADEGRCTVEYEPSTVDTDAIAAAIEEAGFTPTPTSESVERPSAPLADDRRP